jgi:hypothetical protein
MTLPLSAITSLSLAWTSKMTTSPGFTGPVLHRYFLSFLIRSLQKFLARYGMIPWQLYTPGLLSTLASLRRFLKRSGKSRARLLLKPPTGKGSFVLLFIGGPMEQLHAGNLWERNPPESGSESDDNDAPPTLTPKQQLSVRVRSRTMNRRIKADQWRRKQH